MQPWHYLSSLYFCVDLSFSLLELLPPHIIYILIVNSLAPPFTYSFFILFRFLWLHPTTHLGSTTQTTQVGYVLKDIFLHFSFHGSRNYYTSC